MSRFVAAAVVVSCLAAPLAFAQPSARGELPPGAAARAGLSPDQQKQLQQLRQQFNEQLAPLRSNLERARFELKQLLEAPQPDERAVMAQLDKVTAAQGEVKKNRVALMLRVRALVGPEAWQKLKAERRGRFLHRRGGRGFHAPAQVP